MINHYKRRDVFSCSQDAHREFNGRVSVYHVLKEKQCYPQGCLYFLWHCVLLEKGRKCIKGYSWAGRNCGGCMHFAEEKIHLQPSLMLDEAAYEAFLDDLETFEIWLESITYKRLSVAGTVSAVKPWVERIVSHEGDHLRLLGYLLIFQNGFIGTTRFEDSFYIRVTRSQMRSAAFRSGMRIECSGEIRLDRGRVVIHRPKQIEVEGPGHGDTWSDAEALVAARTAAFMTSQPEKCLECPWGVLADAVDKRERPPLRFRNLYCLTGISHPDGCPERVGEILRKASLSR